MRIYEEIDTITGQYYITIEDIIDNNGDIRYLRVGYAACIE